MAVIYKATNKQNGKSYIGFTVDFDKRKQKHIKSCNNGSDLYFHNALRKYGIDVFDWTILKENATINDETYYIVEYETYYIHGKGYNLTFGGEGKLGYVTTEETKRKISNSHMGKNITDSQLVTLRMNAARMKEVGHTEETKRKISEAHKGKVLTNNHRENISKNHASKKETGSFYKSPEYKEKMSKSTKGKIRTPEQKERIRQGALKRWSKKQ